jgi:hypothetical protein
MRNDLADGMTEQTVRVSVVWGRRRVVNLDVYIKGKRLNGTHWQYGSRQRL